MLYEHAVEFDKSSLGNAFFKAKEGLRKMIFVCKIIYIFEIYRQNGSRNHARQKKIIYLV